MSYKRERSQITTAPKYKSLFGLVERASTDVHYRNNAILF